MGGGATLVGGGVTLRDRERDLQRILAREQDLAERQAQLDDRDRRLSHAEEEIQEWSRRVRASGLPLTAASEGQVEQAT